MITLSSDFGTPYPAAMKGVILKQCDARLVDVAHDFPRQDVRSTAFWLTQTLPEFPPAVHLIVVDPGVGTGRDALVVRAGDHVLVGPDNGVLFPPARALAGGDDDYSADIDAYQLDMGDPRSSTFHGRDVFAPGAAAVHETGIDRLPELDCLSPASSVVDLTLPSPEFDGDAVTAAVLAVDDFGNVITNVPGTVLGDSDRVVVDGEERPVVDSYDHAATGTAVVTVGSHGNVELAVNRGRGDDAFGVSAGETVRLDGIDAA
ncbi:S-adenosylmethionine hydroxide adenosyltransferase family protein [Natronomonas pharaonis DSM 2160]|uniref:S-adenosylmethionine hydroxide adenosyltransferase family protein n=1 Tax=Natronomonas pharaonis (strain ATCC 35678 / DSM 2160 / CIP 103997 / JCM 8858 / NBRC 14720 / NCIMB 2260 / Gabara) TaxID=348780 RepID=A0A1U7EUB4_NATPD|nr:SAM-dependent chlorinase/fluorinase [Natronomonas pharaonis]CAI48544.1 S-adenosylmethionine hydroxide adenosyltransferase family protein [Natronomonas pharaonis DSM 2160]